jgi:hypothetical protein
VYPIATERPLVDFLARNVTTNGAVANYQSVIVTIKTIQISPTAGAFALTNSKDTHHDAQKQVTRIFFSYFLLHEAKHQSYVSTAGSFRNYGQLLILNACLARWPVSIDLAQLS